MWAWLLFLVLSAHRATYLYGASSSRMRNLMPAYALQWKAMQLAKASCCVEYDMFGIAPSPTRRTRCMDCINLRKASAARFTISSVAGIIRLSTTSTITL
ncbi:MAG: peptidoglycan bridge formation glycyltransferase FemA/FemB family protein [Muribaculaceae bacterium]